MKDPNDIDFTTLNWVKQELDETLRQARQALEAYVEDQSDKSQLKYCATYMHQVQGTLRMVELYGAAMVVEEMEKVTTALVEGEIKQTDDMLEVVMRGLVQMPDYLGRLQGGHRDIPIVLLPLLNDLRACRSEKLLSETALFSPDLAAALPASSNGAAGALPETMLRANASKLRLAYQFGLLKWIKGDDVDGNLSRLIAILDRLRSMTVQADARRLWWISSGVLESVLLKALEPSVAVKLLYGKVDREIKRVVDSGESEFDRIAPVDLTKSLLYYAAHSQNKGARIAEIKQLYKLDTLLPTESELEHAKSALSGRNKALLDTVGAAIKEDIMRVKDGLDMFLRGPQANVGDLATQGETLQRVADTLGVLGLGVPRKVVIEQRDIVTNIVTGRQPAEEQTLLDVAGALLFVESSLDDYIDRLGQGQTPGSESAATLKGLELPQAEVRRILDATMKEATVNLSQAKSDIVAFIESPWDHGKIEGIPKLLEEISGALRMLNMPEPAELNDGVTRFIEVELLKHRRVPTSEQLDLMADALASIEYYLEAIREARPNRDRILEVTRRSLEALGYWPVPDPNALGVAASLDNAPSSTDFVSFPDDFESSRIDSLALEPIAASANLAVDNAPVLSLSDIPLTESAALALTPDSLEQDLSGYIIQADEPAVVELTPELSMASADPDSAFSDFDLSMLDMPEASAAQAPVFAEMPVAEQDAAGESMDFDLGFADSQSALPPEAAFAVEQSPVQILEDVAPTTTTESDADLAFLDLDTLIGEEAPPVEEPDFDFSASAPQAPIGDSAFDFAEFDGASALADDKPDAAFEAPLDSDSAFDLASLDAFEFDVPKVEVPKVEVPKVELPAAVIAPVAVSAPPARQHDNLIPQSGFQMVPSDDIDDEIREVFVEEVQDELIGLAKYFPAWKNDQNDFEKLKPVRRSFHTLKGSGRLVGALAIGEFSWKVENMLNRVLDKSIPVSPAVLACLDEAIQALPQLLAGLKGEGNPTANIGGIMYVADRVSAGEEMFLPKNEPAPADELASESPDSQLAAGAVPATSVDADIVEPTLFALPIEQTVESVFPASPQESVFPASPQESETELAKPELQLDLADDGAFDTGLNDVALDDAGAFALDAGLDDGDAGLNWAGELESPIPEAAFSAPAPAPAPAIAGGLPDALANDPVLVDILRSEASAHVASIRKYVTQIDGTGIHLGVSDELLRSVHTLNGAIAMVDLPFVSNVVGPLEGYLKRVKGKSDVVDERGLEALTDTADLVERVMQCIDRGDVRGISTDALERHVVSLRDNLPEPEQRPLHELLGEDPEHESDVGGEPLMSPSEEFDTQNLTIDDFRGEAEKLSVDLFAKANKLDSYSADGDVELFAIADLDDLEAYSVSADTVSTDSDALSARSDQLVADLARLEEQAFAPIAEDSESDFSRPAPESRGEAGKTDSAFSASPAEPAAELAQDSELLDLAFLDSDSLGAPWDEPASPLEELQQSAPAAIPIAGFADLSFLEADVDSNVSIQAPEHEQELVDLDALAFEDAGFDAPSNPFENIDLNAASPDSDVFADMGLFDELEVPEASDAVLFTSETTQAPRGLAQPVQTAEETVDLSALLGFDTDLLADESVSPASPQEYDFSRPARETADAFNSVETADEAGFDVQSVDELVNLDDVMLTDDGLPDFFAPDRLENTLADSQVDSELADVEFSTPIESQPDVGAPQFWAPDVPAQSELSEQITSTHTAGTDVEPTDIAEFPQSELGMRVLPIAADIDPDGPLVLVDPDDELLEIFVQEGADILDTSDNMMARLRETPNDFDIVIGLQRELHTLKGGARMAGINAVGDLSHSMESLFEAIVDNRAKNSPVAMEALERSFDRLHQMVTRVGKRQAIGQPEHVIARLDAIVDGRDDEFVVLASVESAPEAVSAAVLEKTVVAPQSPVPLPTVVSAPAAPVRKETKTALDDDDGAARQQQESIRVRADLIDNLVNFAGEVSIYRSRLEAQIGGFRFNLQEFDQTVSRLREQLRKLEMETEAQILSRYQREEVKKDAGFDPLELDRFSTLQQLSRALAESVSDLVSLQALMDDIARQSETLLLQQSRVSTELQEGLMRTRMVPFDSLVPRLRRIIRQTGGELGKRANLKMEGSQGEMDRTVLDRMTAPLEHMLRNALAHGLESPKARLEAGKSEDGNVTISVARDATEVVIKVTDDGKGMDRDAIRKKAIERGLLRPDAQLSDRDLFQFILETGFSTAETVSKIAGRGVGMDVVNSEIKQLGGSLLIDSVKGVGSVFTVRLPFTLSVTQAILIKLADTPFAVPLSSVQGVIRMPRKELDRRIQSGDMELTYAGETYQIYDLGELIRQPIAYAKDESQVPLVMTKSGDQRAAVRVSQVVGSKEVVVKSVGAQLSSVPGFFGATIMGDGSVIVILDLAPLVRHGAALRQAPELAAELDLDVVVTAPVEVRRQKLVMVVDDSITMRKVTTRVLERNDMEVVTAKDGLDAVEQLQDRVPDLMLLDIEMPRMDGYELATYVKNDSRLKHIPIIMITSRTGDKHRQRAMEIGVERYLGKPYQEVDLLKNVMESLNGVSAKR
jgi:chemosensory pili system protein ChpA (sensor histidine kinase/response regulator)